MLDSRFHGNYKTERSDSRKNGNNNKREIPDSCVNENDKIECLVNDKIENFQ